MPSVKDPSPPRSFPVRYHQRLLASLRRLHGEYRRNIDLQDLFAVLVEELLRLTGSPHGGGAEVIAAENGSTGFKLRAAVYPKDAPLDWLDPLYQTVLAEGVPLHQLRPHRSGLPSRWLGMPVFSGGELIALAAVANRAAGYEAKTAVQLAPLLQSFSALLAAARAGAQSERLRRALARELEGRRRIDDALRDILAAESSVPGTDYFRTLVRQLSKTLDVDAAFISLPAAQRPGSAEFLALFDRGTIIRNLPPYPLAGTPCEEVMRNGVQFCPAALQQRFGHSAVIGGSGWESYFGLPLRDAAGQVLGLVAVADRKPLAGRQPAEAVLQICAARVSAELMRRRSEEKMVKLSQALEQTADAVTITDSAGLIEYVNPAFTTMTGFSAEEALGKNSNLLKSGRHDHAFYRQLWETLDQRRAFRDVFINRRKNGELYYEEKTITPLVDAREAVIHYVTTGKDITERMQTQERLHYLAYHDMLTDLPNRSLFMEWLNHALAVGGNRRLAVICVDVDRFKIINDTLGHDLGDRVLLAVAALLKGCLAKGDTLARLGGDEFAVLVEQAASPADLINRIRKILESAALPLRVDANELYITVSIGVALAPEDGTDAKTLLKNADAALYQAKEEGRHNYQFYSADLSERAAKQLSMETRLYRAMERQEFHLCYQPQVNLATGKVSGLEALLRWQHPELGEVSPLDFIPLLEDTGLIIPVGEWVLRTACGEAARWQALYDMPLRLSVNLSGRQFNDANLHETVRRALSDSRLLPAQLELEITESVLMRHDRASAANLDALQDLGVRIAIDDFGTGYSSLGYLKRFPVDTLKIDRSFIFDVIHSPGDESIIKAIIAMAQSLKVDTVAEGVETLDQLRLLRQCGCHTMQGFLLSRPVVAGELAGFLGRPLALS